MGLRSILVAGLKGKMVAIILVSTAVVGGGTVAMAATPVGQNIVHHLTIANTATPDDYKGKDQQDTATPGATHQDKDQKHDHNQQCAGLPEAQRLATKFSLSTDSKSDDVQAICSLHDDSFKATTTGGASVSASRVYGYGEIDQLLTYAQFLAGHDQSNADGKLTSSNARTYLADALHSCGNTPPAVCLKTNTSAGNTGNTGNGGNNGNNGKGKGKPTGTPTPKH